MMMISAAVIRSAVPDPETAAPIRKTASFEDILRSETQPSQSDFDRAVTPYLKKKTSSPDGDDPMQYGIMQSTLKDYDPAGKIASHVNELDEAGAKEIYRKIWERAGCGKLAYPLDVIHFETYVQRPKTAVESLKQSGGDVEAYLDARKSVQKKIKAYKQQGDTGVTGVSPQVKTEKSVITETPRKSKAAPVAGSDFDKALSFILKQEGETLVLDDNGKGPSKFGILQSTLKELDPKGKIANHVKDLDLKKTTQLYRKLWEKSGSQDLAYPMNVIHFDTYIHRPKTAYESLKTAEQSPESYLENRQTSLKSLKSYRKFGSVWEKRITQLSQFVTDTGNGSLRKKI